MEDATLLTESPANFFGHFPYMARVCWYVTGSDGPFAPSARWLIDAYTTIQSA